MSTEFTDINNYFDQVYVLNLDKRPDRKIAMLEKLRRLGIQAEFVQAVDGYTTANIAEHRHYLAQPIGGKNSHKLERKYKRKLIKSPGAWGYLKTYYGILQDAKQRRFERILCFDDDVLFHNDFENQFNRAIQEISEDWKLLYLGASQYVWKIPQGLTYPDQSKKIIDKNEPYYFPNNTDGSFAMGIHASVFDILISDILDMNCPFDSGALRSVIKKYPKNCFVINPNIVVADVSESDIREGQDQNQLAERLMWDMKDYDLESNLKMVSVIMPAYNAERTIEKAIKSILIQSYTNLELIVVNDASTDNTKEIVTNLIHQDPRIKLINLEENKGVGVARNEGLKIAKGDFIALQDADDISLKDRLIKQLVPIIEKSVLFTASKIYRSRCSIEELDLTDQKGLMDLVERKRKQTWMGAYDYIDLPHIGLVTSVYRREVFERFGIYDEHRFAEDMEFTERILYFLTGEKFNKRYNGHTFLSENQSVPKIYHQVNEVLFVCSVMNVSNLTVQFGKKQEENHLRAEGFRVKYETEGQDAYPKLLPISPSVKESNQIIYNTLKINSFIFPLQLGDNKQLRSNEENEGNKNKESKMQRFINVLKRKANTLLGN